MGLFDFVKDVGSKLGIGKDDEKAAVEEYVEEQQKGNALWHMIRGLGLEVEDMQIQFDDGVTTITGNVPDQAEKEKVILALGNTQGVAQVDDRMVVVEPAPEATFYTVKPGDSLSKIALAQYGDAMKYPAIFEANKPMLKDPDLIYPGQVLRIPADA